MKPPAQLILFADILPDGSGGFRLRPAKPVLEVETPEAARLLGFKSRASIHALLDDPIASKILRWRRLSLSPRSKILIETSSLLEYRKATQEVGK